MAMLARIGGLSTCLVVGLLCVGLYRAPVYGGEVSMTIVNIETPQGVKIWVPESIFAKKGDTVSVHYTGTLTDNVVTINPLPQGASGTIDTSTTPGVVYLNLTAVPEPAGAGLLAATAGAVLSRRRRRQ